MKNIFAWIIIVVTISFITRCRNDAAKQVSTYPVLPVQQDKPSGLTAAERKAYSQKAQDFYNEFLHHNPLNGSFLLAKNGEILLEKNSGFADFESREPIDSNTVFHLASISKTFTAVAILKLWEQHKLSLEDEVRLYIPTFPYRHITIRMLLSHRSGLPDYLYIMPKRKSSQLYSNDEVISYYITKKPALEEKPGTSFHYCNINYVILAEIIERVSNEDFSAYMNRTIFKPLHMQHTFILTNTLFPYIARSYNSGNNIYKTGSFDAIYGDKNVYSNARDLLTWDKALYQDSFIRSSTMTLAYQATNSHTKSVENYGLGWRLIQQDGTNIIYHSGRWHGNCNNFIRLIQDTTTLIILSNRYNRHVYLSDKAMITFARKGWNNQAN